MTENSVPVSSTNFIPAVFAVLWIGALEWYRFSPKIGLIGVAIMLLAIIYWSYRHRRRLVSPVSFWLGIGLFLLATLGALSFVAAAVSQHVVIVVTGFVAWLFLDQATHETPPALQGRVAAFVMTATYFAGMLTLLSFAVFVFQPWWVVTIAGAGLYVLVAVIVWLDLGVPKEKFIRTLPWLAWFGAEIALGAWWLPTSVYVGSVMATTVGMLLVHLGRHVWRDTWEPSRGRRYIAIGAGIILLVLLSARWF